MDHNNSIHHEESTNLNLCNLGYNYQHGIGVEKDEHKAFIYYQKSAEMGDADGTFLVGHCYQDGIGVEKDEHKAFIYYQKSAEMGDAGGIFQVGYCYGNGIGVEKDEHKAFIYYQKSAEMGHAVGTYNVGYCYLNGIGVEKDEHKAFIYYQKSAEMGDADGTRQVGHCYQDGIGVEKDEHKAFIYYQKSAEMGDADGTFLVGYCYLNGIGVEKDEHKAFIYYQKSAEIGDFDGTFMTGFCYRNGKGIKRDIQKANYWFKKYYELIIDNEIINDDNDVKKMLDNNNYQLSWIPYKNLKFIEEVGKGGFGKISKAEFKPRIKNGGTSEFTVALKEFDSDEYLNELRAYMKIGADNPSFLRCYGISKNENGKYILILEYALKGSLRKNLNSVTQLNWEKKLKLIQCIVYDLITIHSVKYVHKDLHSGNILQDYVDNAYIADLGLTSLVKDERGKIFGVLPYVAPEVLQENPFTQAADIYSLGIILWEISTGQRPFDGYQFNRELAIKICLGFCPEFSPGTPNCYIELVQQCISIDPEKRPNAMFVLNKIENWIESYSNSEYIDEIKTQFLKSDEIIKTLPIIKQQHPDHMYTSKPINTGEIAEQMKQMRISQGISQSIESVEMSDL